MSWLSKILMVRWMERDWILDWLRDQWYWWQTENKMWLFWRSSASLYCYNATGFNRHGQISKHTKNKDIYITATNGILSDLPGHRQEPDHGAWPRWVRRTGCLTYPYRMFMVVSQIFQRPTQSIFRYKIYLSPIKKKHLWYNYSIENTLLIVFYFDCINILTVWEQFFTFLFHRISSVYHRMNLWV